MEKYYRVEEVAQNLQVHWQTVLNYIKKGDLQALKLGKGYRIAESDLKNFINNFKTKQL